MTSIATVVLVESVGFGGVSPVVEHGPVRDDPRDGPRGPGNGLACRFTHGFEERSRRRVRVSEEPPHGLGARERPGHTGEGREPGRDGVHHVCVFPYKMVELLP